ncbi:MAG: peptidyl-prolyl cis-trans isomerase [Deltaproteobacteria bacterium]|nr:peptidyl-prolyl cis-trans isomerase [Deltaproteobacteria bacterium]
MRALASQIASEVPQPSQEAVRAVFDLQRSRYRTPELRAVGLIFTRDRAAAEQALTALLAGDQRQAPQEWMRAAERIGFAGPRRQPREETEFFAALPRDGEAFVAQPVRDAAFETEPGAIHPALVPYDDGFYIVRVSSRAEPTDISFEEAAPRIRAELHEEAVDSAVTQLIAERLAAATYDDAALEAVVVPAEASAP